MPLWIIQAGHPAIPADPLTQCGLRSLTATYCRLQIIILHARWFLTNRRRRFRPTHPLFRAFKRHARGASAANAKRSLPGRSAPCPQIGIIQSNRGRDRSVSDKQYRWSLEPIDAPGVAVKGLFSMHPKRRGANRATPASEYRSDPARNGLHLV